MSARSRYINSSRGGYKRVRTGHYHRHGCETALPQRAEYGWKWNRGAISDGHMSPGRAYSRRQSRGNAIRSLPACLLRCHSTTRKYPVSFALFSLTTSRESQSLSRIRCSRNISSLFVIQFCIQFCIWKVLWKAWNKECVARIFLLLLQQT